MATQHPDIFRLYLLRHAHAAWPSPGGRDFDRALDAKGVAEARRVALAAYAAGMAPERIVSSTARRCRETTAAFIDIFGDLAVDYDDRLYSEGIEAYMEQIGRHDGSGSLMLVGHNPMIEQLALSLSKKSSQSAALALGYPTAGLLALDFRRPVERDLGHRGEPVSLVTPALT